MAHFALPSHVIIGKNGLEEAVTYIKDMGNRAFIVTGPHVSRSPMVAALKKILEASHIAYYVYDGITGEPTEVMIEKGVEQYKSSKSQFLIGIGGGSPLDAAKAIAVMSVSEGSISDFMGREICCKIPQIVAIPTTSGTGSEATKFTVITDSKTDIKMLLKGDCLIPDVAILNYEYTFDMPRSVTAATGLDALTHAIEAYTSKKAMDLTDVYAISSVKRIMKYLPLAYKNGLDCYAREQMTLAAFEAGVCINNSSVTIVHGMSRPIGAIFHVPHGMSNAMLLPDCLSFALDGTYERFATLARACGVATSTDDDKTASEKFIKEIVEVVKICEVPSLQGYGIDKEEFVKVIPKMALDAIASGSPGNTRKTVTEEDCRAIYEKVINN